MMPRVVLLNKWNTQIAYRYKITTNRQSKIMEPGAFCSAFVASVLLKVYVANFINFAVKVSLLIPQFTLTIF